MHIHTRARMYRYNVASVCYGVREKEMIPCVVGYGCDGELQGAWSVWVYVCLLLVRHVRADVCVCHSCVWPPGSAEWEGG